MSTTDFKTRVHQILEFITEITLGNYTYTLPLRNQKDELEQIAVSLNTMVEEIDTAVHQINHEKSKEVIENIVFNLDCNFHITSYSTNIKDILGYSDLEILNRPVKFLINGDSNLPEDLQDLLEHTLESEPPFRVEFKHRDGLQWSGLGRLYVMVTEGKKTYSLSVFKTIYTHDKFNLGLSNKPRSSTFPSEYRSLLLQDQRILVRKLHQYVMERLDRPLPKISIIGREIGCSVSKIKTIFKRFYGDTIYAYHRKKRLEKARTLIEDTSTPLNEISEECGFLSQAHFSRTFKKMYGLPPSQIRKF
ncbi:AraC family transcriptional regulator [Psychroflexus tropicus]|uniref:AraC family transcriptional regulator n=1 Tax=Psychroflexus tropicus TaxID=197345 RepID=UPI000375B361|nr:helix-turn-helix domain-containing protein [Psychroflexus tropicus]